MHWRKQSLSSSDPYMPYTSTVIRIGLSLCTYLGPWPSAVDLRRIICAVTCKLLLDILPQPRDFYVVKLDIDGCLACFRRARKSKVLSAGTMADTCRSSFAVEHSGIKPEALRTLGAVPTFFGTCVFQITGSEFRSTTTFVHKTS